MSCFNDLKGYCGKDILGEWYHNLYGEWHDYFKHNGINYALVICERTSYQYSTIKNYIYQTKKTYRHWTKEEYEKNYKIVVRYVNKRKKEKKEQEIKRKIKQRQDEEYNILHTKFIKESNMFFEYAAVSPGVYVLECCDKNFKPIGVKVGSTGKFVKRFYQIQKNLTNSAIDAGIRYYRPLAYFPTIGENFDISRAYAYKLESALHIFMERFKSFEHVGNDHFIFTNEDEHFRLYELFQDEETTEDLYAMVEDFNDNFSLQQSILETYTKFRYL